MSFYCCFHICQFDLEACKINETFQTKLHMNHHVFPPTYKSTLGQECLSS